MSHSAWWNHRRTAYWFWSKQVLDTDNLWQPQFLEVMTGELRPADIAAYSGRHLFLMHGSLADARVAARRTHSPAYNPAALMRGNSIDLNVLLRHVDQVLVDHHCHQRAQTPSITNRHYGEAHLRSPFGLGEPDEATARVLGTIEAELGLRRRTG